MKKLAVIAMSAAVVLVLAGCGGSSQSSATSSASSGSAEASSSQTSAKAFDGSAFADTGEGTMYLRTAGGTSEGGNVPEIAAKSNSVMQIEIDTEGMDGSVCTVYVDGVENTTVNAGDRSQNALTLQGDALATGTHTVELVKMDGDNPVIYKKAEYKVA